MSEHHARDSYLESQINTATPQKLRLMLIEAAIRCGRQVVLHWEADDQGEALQKLTRCRSIVSELLASVKVEDDDLTQRVAGVYLFLYRALTEAQLTREAKIVEDVIRVLEIERDTWQLVCEQLPHAPITPEVSSANGEVRAPISLANPPSSSLQLDA